MLARSLSQLSATTKQLTTDIPVINLAKVHTMGFMYATIIKILKDAKDAQAAKTLIWPTLETSFGARSEPTKYPT